MKPGRWWTRSQDRFVCELCPRRCHLQPGQRGFCFVRQATDQGVALATYGRSSGFCIDPIEKKPLNHFLPGTPVLSFGTAGCNLGCRFCQNWNISKAREDDALMVEASPERIAQAAARTGCRSVAFTYNDPVIFAEYALDTAAACRERDIASVAVTAGYIAQPARAEFFAGMDATNVDLKAFTESFYKELCYGRLEPVKETLKHVAASDTWLEVTTLVIPGHNDSDRELRELAGWMAEELGPEVPLHLTAYHPDFKLEAPRTPACTLFSARRWAQEEGLMHVYTGNILDTRGGSTWCAGCGELLIERRGYELGRWHLRHGACASCARPLPGRFEARPGDWGGRRQRIRP